MGIGALSEGVNWPVSEVNHSCPPGAEAKNEWRYNTTPAIGLHSLDGENVPLPST